MAHMKPDIIKVTDNFQSYCNGCTFDRTYTETLYSDDGSKVILVKCEDEERCARLYEHIKAEMGNAGRTD